MASSFNAFFKTFKMESKVISEETISSIKGFVEQGDIQKTISTINAALAEVEKAPLSIAVTGETGAGKSTFINALRGIGHEETDSARSGVVETTMDRGKYTHSKFPNVTIWDLPGVGSTTFKPEEYLKKMKFQEYDFFLIISATRFKDNDAQLAKAIRKMRKNFYFVRTKIDSDLWNQRRCTPKTYNKEKTLETIRKNCVENLQKAGVSFTPVFLVSSVEVALFDFPHLESTLLKELPAHKRHIFMQCLPNVTEAAIDRRKDVLKQKIWLEALKYGETAVSLMCDTADLRKSFENYQKLFGVDDGFLQQVAQRIGTLQMGCIAMKFQELHTKDWRLRLMMSFPMCMFLKCLEVSWWYGLWNFFTRGLRLWRQSLIIEIVAQDAKTVLRSVLKDNTHLTEVL
ncbi:T-cell-specific guanine nucleotide triphosphate-binding protein 2 [Lemmus lemmus]